MHLSQPRAARRSVVKEGRRSASAAPAYIHLVPILLMFFLIAAAIQVGWTLLKPLTVELANSWQPELSQSIETTSSESTYLLAFTPEVQRWHAQIDHWAEQTGLPPALIATVIQIESCGDPLARSGAGALGLFQVMPFHFDPDQDPLKIENNARAGLEYLVGAYRLADGDVQRSLAGYNGGHSVINQPASSWHSETKRYAFWGTGIMHDIEQGNVPSHTLNQWLEAGGYRLCEQASLRPMVTR